jgi:hypothetical protein
MCSLSISPSPDLGGVVRNKTRGMQEPGVNGTVNLSHNNPMQPENIEEHGRYRVKEIKCSRS